MLSYVLAICLGGVIAGLLWAAAIDKYSSQAAKAVTAREVTQTHNPVQSALPLSRTNTPKHLKLPGNSSSVRITQQSAGPNSPNTAVVGNNDQITINPLPPKLTLTDVQQSDITSLMKPYVGQKISIFLNNETDSTWEFGSQLRAAFENAGVSVYMTYGIVAGARPVPSGISISFSGDRKPMADAIVSALVGCGVLKNGPVPRIPVPKETRDTLGLVITPLEN